MSEWKLDGKDNIREVEREFEWTSVIGATAQGKSTMLSAMIMEEARLKPSGKILVWDITGSRALAWIPEITLHQLKYGVDKFGDGKRYPFNQGVVALRGRLKAKDVLEVIITYIRNTSIYLDEYNSYSTSTGVPPDYEADLFRMRRNWGLDIITTIHSFENIPRQLRTFIATWIMFKPASEPDGVQWFKQRGFRDAQKLWDAYCRVMKMPDLTPKGKQYLIKNHVIVKHTFVQDDAQK
jgi:hypothetical protein